MTQKNERAFLLYTLAHINTHSDIWTENCLPFLLLTQTFGVPKRQKRKTNYQWLELKWVKVRHICLWFTWANPASKSPARSPWLQGLIFQLPPQRPAAPLRGCSHDLVLLVPDPVRSIAHHATTVCYIGFNLERVASVSSKDFWTNKSEKVLSVLWNDAPLCKDRDRTAIIAQRINWVLNFAAKVAAFFDGNAIYRFEMCSHHSSWAWGLVLLGWARSNHNFLILYIFFSSNEWREAQIIEWE